MPIDCRRLTLASLMLCSMAGNVAGATGETNQAGVIHHYRVRINTALTELVVRAQPATTSYLTAPGKQAKRLTRRYRACGSSKVRTIWGRRIKLTPSASSCIEYRVELTRERADNRYGQKSLDTDRNRVLPVADWLWLPPSQSDAEVQVQFIVPRDVQVSVPWRRVAGEQEHTYTFGGSPQSGRALSAFGRFSYREITVPGAVLRAAILHGGSAVDADKMSQWLAAAARNVSQAYGYFPNPAPQVLVVPVVGSSGYWSASAVPFGHVLRDGGEAVQFFVNQQQPLQAFLGDWTATHEFSHLLLPYVQSAQSWVAEGFASYYQNVLLARGGVYSATEAWQHLFDGLERARTNRVQVSPNATDDQEFWQVRMLIYWSGAALALIADVSLREQTANAASLDSVLQRLQRCCLPSARVWAGRELFRKLDELAPFPLFVELYDRYADRVGVPAYPAVLERLGVATREGRVRLVDQAPLRAVREAIMAATLQ